MDNKNIDSENKFEQLSTELINSDAPAANKEPIKESTQQNVKEVITEFDKLLSNINSL